MATHRPKNRGCAPDVEFQFALAVLEASEDLAARRRPITPLTLARQLRVRTPGERPTLAQIERGLAQVRCWRDQLLTRNLLQHRRQIIELCARIEAEQYRLGEDWVYLIRMLQETDAILQNTLAAPSAVPPSAGASARDGPPHK